MQRAGLVAAVMQESDSWSGYGDSASNDLIDAMLPSSNRPAARSSYRGRNGRSPRKEAGPRSGR